LLLAARALPRVRTLALPPSQTRSVQKAPAGAGSGPCWPAQTQQQQQQQQPQQPQPQPQTQPQTQLLRRAAQAARSLRAQPQTLQSPG
jgi:hypothetical protein